MSRIIVKNLPLYLTDDQLRKHFGKRGAVTDAKLMKTHDGKSRRFGFIGFKSDQEAQDAVKYFDKSFIDTFKIHVELAKNLGDFSLRTQTEKREMQKRQREEREEKVRAKKQKTGTSESESDPKLKEYLDVMGSRKNAKSWANDDESGAIVQEDADASAKAPLVDEKDSDGEYDDNTEQQEPQQKQQQERKDEDEDGEDEEMIPMTASNDDDGLANSNVSDMEWLQMRRTRMVDGKKVDQEKVQETDQDGDQGQEQEQDEDQDAAPELQQTEHQQKVQQIIESKRLFLRNLLYSLTEEELRQHFAEIGPLEEVHIPIDPKKNKSKGFAYVMFKSGEDAARAFEMLDGTTFQGRLLHILPGKPKRENKLDEFDLKNLPLKKQNELKRKFNAAKQQFSWNSLYMSTDAVMSSVASKMGISKTELLNPESSDGAVQQALAETSVLNSVREYFESKGVDLLSFNKKERSDTVILVKNFPHDTKVEEIADLFGQYGDVKKLLMPPDGGIAIVVFKTVPQGRAAFTKLAFRRFRSSILYLEKGPKGLFEDGSDEPEQAGEEQTEQVSKEVTATAAEVLGEQPEDNDNLDTTSLFVKNLNFKTTNDDLTRAFRSLQGFMVARVKTRPDKKDSTKILSEGYGFVEFKTKHDAEVAASAMNDYVLDGHKLQCKLSHRGREGDDTNIALPKSKGQTKIIIKNVPFETTKQDIKKLFGTFGQLRSVRVPKKFNKSARGFAFAEYVTAKEAENAMKSLQGVHLLGRRLVMQWAEQDAGDAEEEIARMEAKVSKQVAKESFSGLRLSGKRTIDLEGEDDSSVL